MFGVISGTKNIPSVSSTSFSHDERTLVTVLEIKQKYMDIINHLSSIPHTDDDSLKVNSNDQFINHINETITSCIREMNNLEECISDVRYRCTISNRMQAKDDMVSMFSEFVKSYPNRDELIATYKKWMSGPTVLFRKEKRIYEIATEIFNFLKSKEPLKIMFTSPFLQWVYIKCIMALVICVPFHNMKNIRFFFQHFDNSVHVVTNNILLIFHSLINGSLIDQVESTKNEWGILRGAHTYDASVDPCRPTLMLNGGQVGSDEIRYFCYPKVDYKYSDERDAFIQAKYHTSMVMHEIISLIQWYYIDEIYIHNYPHMSDDEGENVDEKLIIGEKVRRECSDDTDDE